MEFFLIELSAHLSTQQVIQATVGSVTGGLVLIFVVLLILFFRQRKNCSQVLAVLLNLFTTPHFHHSLHKISTPITTHPCFVQLQDHKQYKYHVGSLSPDRRFPLTRITMYGLRKQISRIPLQSKTQVARFFPQYPWLEIISKTCTRCVGDPALFYWRLKIWGTILQVPVYSAYLDWSAWRFCRITSTSWGLFLLKVQWMDWSFLIHNHTMKITHISILL